MRILHILDHSLPVKDGYAFRTRAIMTAQRARGWDVVGLTSPKHYESDATPWHPVEERDGVSFHRTPPVRASRTRPAQLQVVSAIKRQLEATVAAERPDVLHAHSPTLNVLPALSVGRRFGLPVVYEVRASWEDAAVSLGKFNEGSWKYRLSRMIETQACRRADHVTVLCEGLKGEFISRGIPAEKLTPIPNGVDLEGFAPAPPDSELFGKMGVLGKRVVGFVGTFFPWEGLHLLVEAFGVIAQRRSDVVLLLVGEGGVEQQLRRQIAERGLEAVVKMPGSVSQAQVPGLYAGMDALVYPRTSMRLTELVTPLKPLEAMASRRAVLASDVGGHRELLKHDITGLIFRSNDAADLARTIARLLDEPALQERLARDGHKWVRAERSWSTTTAPYEFVYQQLISGRVRRGR